MRNNWIIPLLGFVGIILYLFGGIDEILSDSGLAVIYEFFIPEKLVEKFVKIIELFSDLFFRLPGKFGEKI